MIDKTDGIKISIIATNCRLTKEFLLIYKGDFSTINVRNF